MHMSRLDPLIGWPRLQKIFKADAGVPPSNSNPNPEFVAALSSVCEALVCFKYI